MIKVICVIAAGALLLVGCTKTEEVADLDATIDSDIIELYARTDYLFCVEDAEVLLDDAKTDEDNAYQDYLADNTTYSQYQAEYDAYSEAYDEYDRTLDECFDVYEAGE